MDRLETRELSYFVAVARQLHFGRAAEQLGIAQPPLSRAISRLERRLGTPLLNRSTRRVTLTAAGETFLRESEAILRSVDDAVRRTRAVGGRRVIKFAVSPGTGSDALRRLLVAYREVPGAAELELAFTRDHLEALRSAQADLAILCATEVTGSLATMDLGVELPVALLPATHPLAGRPGVQLSELRALAGFRSECPSMGLDEVIERVALQDLVTVVGSSAALRVGSGVAAVPVVDAPSTRVQLAWTQHNRLLVDDVVRTAEALTGRAAEDVAS